VTITSPRYCIKQDSCTREREREGPSIYLNIVVVVIRRFLQSQKFSNATRVQTHVGQDACVKLRAVTRLFFLHLTGRGKLQRYLTISLRYRYFLTIRQTSSVVQIGCCSKETDVFFLNNYPSVSGYRIPTYNYENSVIEFQRRFIGDLGCSFQRFSLEHDRFAMHVIERLSSNVDYVPIGGKVATRVSQRCVPMH